MGPNDRSTICRPKITIISSMKFSNARMFEKATGAVPFGVTAGLGGSR